MQIFRQRRDKDGDDEAVPGRVLLQPPPSRPARFRAPQVVDEYVIHEWDTAYGTIGWAHHVLYNGTSAFTLSDAVYGQFWEHWHEAYSALVIPAGGLSLDLAPRLQAIDLHPGGVRSDTYDVTWEQVAGILGTRPPWWHWALRDKAAMLAWKPGDPPAIVAPDHLDVPARAPLELAADEPEGSPVAAACLWLARIARERAGEEARDDIGRTRAEARKEGSDCAYVHVAAVPADPRRPDVASPGETVMRAAWAEITGRRDTLAWEVARLAQRWDGGRTWPAGETAEFTPDSSPAAAEWTAGLQSVPADQPPTVLERLLLEHVRSVDQGELLHDETSGFPAVRRTDHLGTVTVFASVPQRIASASELAEVTFGGRTVWIRTKDGRLWLAPEVAGSGLSWGYSGGGPVALAQLLDRLLDDITAPPVLPADRAGQLNEGLFDLVRSAPQDDVTVYNRAQLLAARAG